MSRRKQSNPKPLLKSDCQESVDEMTVERDNKDFCSNDLVDEVQTSELDNNSEQMSSDSIQNEGESPTPPPPPLIQSINNINSRSTLDNSINSNSSLELSNKIQSSSSSAISSSLSTAITSTCLSSMNSEITTVTTTMTATITTSSSPSSSSSSPSSTTANIKNDVADSAITHQPTISVPKLRLNVSLASDPALKPDAKDIKIIQDIDDDEDDDGDENECNINVSSSSRHPPIEILSSSSYNKKSRLDTIIDDDEPTLLNVSSNLHSSNNIISSGQHKSQITKPTNIDVGHRLKVFMCHPCGIGFSSHSTLEAHQKYYCSHRQEVDEDNVPSNNVLVTSTDKSSSGEPLTKSLKTGKQYACTQCSYSADKKVSLNRHMRMHQSSPAPSSNTSNGEESSSQQIDRYCSECDIRFSNVKTYRAHKQHYCSSRRTDGQTPPKQVTESKKSGSISPQTRSKTPTSVAPPQPFLALPTNPILIIPYSIIRAANLLPGPLTSVTSGVANPDVTCFTFENGTLHAIATALSTHNLTESSTSRVQSTHCNTIGPLLSEKNTKNSNNVPKLSSSKKEGSSRETVPLDLSVRKSPILFPRSSFDMMASIGLSSFEENKLDIEAMMEGKENLSIVGGGGGKLTPEQIVCSPSLPSSPSMSPSPKRRSSPRVGTISSTSPVPNCLDSSSGNVANIRSLLPPDLSLKLVAEGIPSLLSKQHIELALKLANKPNEVTNVVPATAATVGNVPPSSSVLSLPSGNPISVVPPLPNVQPQIYVKQGVSKCKECNIVFCKFENYLAHKQHYCSSRNQDDTEVKGNTPPAVTNSTDSAPPPVAYHQLICAACGIKYTSLDNLRAHQTFYCPKGGELAGSSSTTVAITGTANSSSSASTGTQISTGKEKCNKCKIIHDLSKQCSPISAIPNQNSTYKCPVCGVISLNAADSRKHLETHGSVKAFRCSICRYKGNTLRGMRTHIRMHFDKKSTDFNEENYMSCILEEEGVEISSTSASNQDPNSQQLYNCEICNYSSSYKGNVIRHMKLVHSQQGIGTPSTSPEIGEGDEPLTVPIQNGDISKINLNESVTIKLEPLDKEKESLSPQQNSSVMLNDEEQIHPLKKVKIEPNDTAVTCFSPPPLGSIPIIGQQLHATDENNVENSTSSSNENGSNGDSLKYCRNCDIKFNYINTYIAHKQFYCKNNKSKQQQPQQLRSDIKTPSPVPIVVQSGMMPTTLGNSNKNKENMETVL